MTPVAVSAEEERRRKIVNINPETVTNVTSTDFPHHYPGEDHSWSLEQFEHNFHVQFHGNQPNEATFSLIGIDASIANAFRRILIAEVPTLAIEYVYIESNDSVISDEILAARLGQIPLTASQEGLRWLNYHPRPPQGMLGEDSGRREDDRVAKDVDTIVLKLHVKCNYKKGKDAKSEGTPDELYEHHNVYAEDLVWEVQGRQNEFFTEKEGGGIRPVHPKILLTKIRAGDEIKIVCHAVKGIGADHAKFSPVATATYRLLPTIDILKPILGADAKKFARCFPRGVIELEEVTEEENQKTGSGYEGKAGEKKAVVGNTMRDTISRECLRHEEFEGKVKLGRVQDHFIFAVESTGQMPSNDLFIESVRILRGKCRALKAQLGDIMR